MLKKVPVTIHGGDYDCSEMVRMCYASVGVLPKNSWMWTGNEDELLRSHGFRRLGPQPAAGMVRGDVLLRSGHTEIYLGKNLQGGARIDESGRIYGRVQGDQTGGEIAKSAYTPNRWQSVYRYIANHTLEGIPSNEAAAQVAEHIIDHAAHGYSQPNRSGDGTTETVIITYHVESEDEMTCIIEIQGRSELLWFDGININDLTHPADASVLEKVYKGCNGEKMPRVKLTEDEFARLCQSIKGGYPKSMKALVDKYPARSPE